MSEMEQTRKNRPAIRVSARIERAERTAVDRPGTLRERARFVTDIVVEDLSRTGCRICTDADMSVGTLISIGIPGVGMQAARVVRSEGNVHGCSFLLPITEADVLKSQTVVTVENLAFPTLRERVRSEAGFKHTGRDVDGKKKNWFIGIISRSR